jgi:hypothetical protein
MIYTILYFYKRKIKKLRVIIKLKDRKTFLEKIKKREDKKER